MKTYKITIKKGKILNKDYLLDHLTQLDDGNYNVFIEKGEVGQAKYFFYRDVIADFLGYGTKREKQELHEYIKLELLPEIFKDPENLNTENYDQIEKYSTTYLSPRGFNSLNRNLEIWSLTKFGIKLI